MDTMGLLASHLRGCFQVSPKGKTVFELTWNNSIKIKSCGRWIYR